jgi:hypothetical protein
LADWVWRYFEAADSPPTLLAGGSGDTAVVVSTRMPLYFQHDGHSRTIVGVERRWIRQEAPTVGLINAQTPDLLGCQSLTLYYRLLDNSACFRPEAPRGRISRGATPRNRLGGHVAARCSHPKQERFSTGILRRRDGFCGGIPRKSHHAIRSI